MIILLIILLIIIIYLIIKLEKQKIELEHAIGALDNKAYAVAQEAYKKAKAEIDAEISKAHTDAELYKKTIADGQADYEGKLKLQQIRALEVYQEGLKDFNKRAAEEAKQWQSSKDKMLTEWREVYDQLEDAKKRRDAINQEIVRQRELEEKEDFFKVQLTQDDITDIQLINEVRPKLHKNTSLDKLIYDLYVAKPVNEMIKRVLEGESPSGIYKITRQKTGEVYIGKSTNIHDRWQQHAKSAFHCGTISHSVLHTTMEKDGIQNFTFELLEEVPKDKLSEREKYWITFYDSSKYGLNERIG